MKLRHIACSFDEDGGFIVGDYSTNATDYAYPTSPNAQRARRDAVATAVAMLDAENAVYRGYPPIVREYDARNWRKLDALHARIWTITKESAS